MRNQEDFVREIKTTLDKAMEEKKKLLSQIQTSNGDALKEEMSNIKGQIDELSKLILGQNQKIEELKNNYKAKNDIYMDSVRECKKYEIKMIRMRKDIDSIKQHIAEQMNM